MCCWNRKKTRNRSKKKLHGHVSKSIEQAVPLQRPIPKAVNAQDDKPDEPNRFRAALLKSREDQKTIAVGTLAQIICQPGAHEAVNEVKGPEVEKPIVAPAKAIAVGKPTEQTATDGLTQIVKSCKTAKTQTESVAQRSKKQKASKPAPVTLVEKKPLISNVANQKNDKQNEKKLASDTKKIQSLASRTVLSMNTVGAQISADGREEPEVFENHQLGSSTMRALEYKKAQSSTNALRSIQKSAIGRDIIVGFPDNLSDENEGEKLYKALAPPTFSGMVSHLHDDGIAGTHNNEDGKAPSRDKLEKSRVARKAAAKRRERDDDTLRDIPRTLPEMDYDEFLPPIAAKKPTKLEAATKEEEKHAEDKSGIKSDTIKDLGKNSEKVVQSEPNQRASPDVKEDKTPPSTSPPEPN